MVEWGSFSFTMIDEGYIVLVAFDALRPQCINGGGNVSMYHFAAFTFSSLKKQHMFRYFAIR